jgi:hypothetical protein
MMRRFWMGFLALGLLLGGCGGSGPGSGGTNTTVLGTVYDSATGDLEVQGAIVAIGGVTGTTTTVDQASATRPVGSFALSGVPTGATTALVTAPGQAPQTIAFQPAIGPGTNAGLSLYLNIGQLRGRVLGPDGRPAAGAFVYVQAETAVDPRQTALDGSFLIENVPIGSATITAILGPAAGSKTVTVGKGLLEAGDLTLVDDPNPNPVGLPRTIFGKVTIAATGEPAGNVDVLLSVGGVQVEQVKTSTAGDYAFYVPVGTYGIRATVPGGAYQDATATIDVTNPSVPKVANLSLLAR